MGKQIKLSEEELHNLIKSKVLEAAQKMVDLGYAPAIGNKKRGPGEEIEDQMKKRRNTKLDESFDEVQGPHDESQIYDDVYAEIEPHLEEWGAGPVYGWKGNKGVCFSVKKADGASAWIVITMMGFNGYYNDDSFLVTISQYGADDPEEADAAIGYVYLYDLNRAIPKLIKKSAVNEGVDEKPIYRRLPGGDVDYDGDDGEGAPEEGSKAVELTDDAYAFAFEQIYGRVPGDLSDVIEEYELPFDVTIKFSLTIKKYNGDYDNPPYSDTTLEDWEIDENDIKGYKPELQDIIQKAVEYEVEGLDTNDLAGYINESKRNNVIRLSENQVQSIIKNSVKRILAEKTFYDDDDELNYRKKMQSWAGSKKFHEDNDKRIAELEKKRDAANKKKEKENNKWKKTTNYMKPVSKKK